MIAQGIDQLRVITPTEYDKIIDHYPVSWMAMYLSSPGQRRTRWTKANCEALADLDISFLPIYVGSQHPVHNPETSDLSTDAAGYHARDAATRLQEMGWPAHRGIPCVLDVEAETSDWQPQQSADYAAAWGAEMDRLGYLPTYYGTISFIRRTIVQCGNFPHQLWVASWVAPGYRADLNARHLCTSLGLEDYRGAILWQYSSENHNPVMKAGYDWNCADARFAPRPV